MTKPPTITVNVHMTPMDPLSIGRFLRANAHRIRQQVEAQQAQEREAARPKSDSEAWAALGASLARFHHAMGKVGEAFKKETERLTVGAPFPTPHMDSFLRDAAAAKDTCAMKGCPGHQAPPPAGDAMTQAVAFWKDRTERWTEQAELQATRADKAEARVKELEAQLADAAKAERERIIKALSDGISTDGFDYLATLIRVDHAGMKIMVDKTLLQSTLEPKP